MVAIGDIAKGVLIFFCGYFLLIAVTQTIGGQSDLGAFMFVCSAVPVVLVINGYVRDRREQQLSNL
jgi:hypothetical protein